MWFDLAIGALERALDLLAVAGGILVAYWLGAMRIDHYATVCSTGAVLIAGVGFGLLVVLLLDKYGDYRPDISLLAVRETERLLRVAATAIPLGLAILFMLTRTAYLFAIVVALMIVPLLIACEKSATQKAVRVLRRGLGYTRKAVIVGTGSLGRKVFSTLVGSPKLGIDPVAFVTAFAANDDPVICESSYQRKRQAPVLVAPVTPRLIRRLEASVLILAEPDMLPDKVASIRCEAEAAGIMTYVIPEPFLDNESSMEYVEMDGVLLAYTTPRNERRLYESGKRALDIVFSALILLATSPLFVVAAIAIRLSSPGPVMFEQQRVGRNGRRFTMYKFRTMHCDCATYARSPITARDPRITKVGRWLRHTCIDELPQLLNVLRGEMSLVGPRPEMPFLVAQYEAIHLKRLSVLPGLTGLWQLSADRMSPIHKNIGYDLYWIEDCVEGLIRLMASEYRAPLNLGTEELVTIDQLVDMVCEIAGKHLHKVHALEKPQGVRGRNSDNSRLRVVLGWEPQIPLATGLEITYRWIEQELERAGRLTPDLVYA